jgi:four helix bundle protein
MTKHDQALYTTNDAAFWEEAPATVREDAPGGRARVFDLEERTARFGEAVIDFAKLIPRSSLTDRLISQLVGCGTSVGANYSEADDAVSKKAFFLSINTCRKEAREAKHFVRMVVRAVPEIKETARPLWQEAKELNLIFSKICRRKEK